MTAPFLTRRDVAQLLRLSPRQLRGQMPALTASGFPAPALGFGQNARWDPLAIEAWRQGLIQGSRIQETVIPVPGLDPGSDPAISIEHILDQRAAALAASGRRRHH